MPAAQLLAWILVLIAVICFFAQFWQTLNQIPVSPTNRFDKPMFGWFCLALALLIMWGAPLFVECTNHGKYLVLC
jgi:hypothetical protein